MLKNNTIYNAIKTQEKLLKKINSTDLFESLELFEQYLYCCERLTVYLRQVISCFPEIMHKTYTETASAEAYEIYIQQRNESDSQTYIIDLPFLLPNRRTAASAFKRTIVQSLRQAIQKFCQDNSISSIEKASVSFISYYAPSESRKMRHDNDNVEISCVLNALTGFLIPDDSSLCCDLHILSRLGDHSFTRITIIETEL